VMMIQVIRAATETRSCSHPKTVEAESESVIKPRQINRLIKLTATYGMPILLTRRKTFGARPSRAIPYSVREEPNSPRVTLERYEKDGHSSKLTRIA
jgi:hypothetical protein